MTLDEAKKAARAEAIERRARAHAALARDRGGAHAGQALCDIFMASVPIPPNAVVSGYWPVKEEIDDRPLLRRLIALGHPCGLPVIVGRGFPLKFRRWHPERPLVAGKWGIATPDEGCEDVEPELVIVPLLAFDRRGNRLGYGAGYYDRTLAGLRARGGRRTLAVGVAYGAQEAKAVPVDDSDERLDRIVTETEAIRITPGKAPSGLRP